MAAAKVVVAVFLVLCASSATARREDRHYKGSSPSSPPSSWWPFSSEQSEHTNDLLKAAEKGDFKKAKEAIEKGADIHGKDKEGSTPLIFASYHGHPDIVRLLLDKGADIEMSNNEGNTPLIVAGFTGETDCIRLLLERGANVDGRNKNGDTPLIGASFFGQLDAVKILLTNGADITAKNREGRASLQLAEHQKHAEIAAVLRDAARGGYVDASSLITPAPHSEADSSSMSSSSDVVEKVEAVGPPSKWSPAAVQSWLASLSLPEAGAAALSRALWRAKVDGEVLLLLAESDFYGEKCKWTGLCNIPFVTARKFLASVHRLETTWAAASALSGDGSFTITTQDSVELCQRDGGSVRCAAP